MQQLLSITVLTIRAAFRFRLIAVMMALLLASVVLLPLIIKDDGTARGFTQILITYTLSVITFFMGFATLWLACGTLARDVEECQMQMVAVKPIPRWQIWLGKWLGIFLLNVLLLSASGLAVYVMLTVRAEKLSAEEQEVLENEVLVARGSVTPPFDDVSEQVDAELAERLKTSNATDLDRAFLRSQIRERILAGQQIVPPGHYRPWRLDFSALREEVKDEPLFLRFKFFTPPEHYESTINIPTYAGVWEVGSPDKGRLARLNGKWVSKSYHEVVIPPGMIDDEGFLRLGFANLSNVSLYFYVDDSIEVLYKESGFAMNFIRGLAVILCWMGLLAALGLTAASFLSFPVAAFLSLGALLVFFSGDTMSRVVSEGTIGGVNHETGAVHRNPLDYVVIPFFRAAVALVNQVENVAPIDFLSSGRSITWSMLAVTAMKIIVLLGGALAAVGMTVFTRRELATAQSQF